VIGKLTGVSVIQRSDRQHRDALLVDLYTQMLARLTFASDIGSVHQFFPFIRYSQAARARLHVMEVLQQIHLLIWHGIIWKKSLACARHEALS
jgi:hypothetical protein